MYITVDHSLPELAQHLNRLYFELNGDLTTPLNSIAGLIEESTRKRFETETAPDGTRWEALSRATLEAKARKGSAGKGILTDEGLMRRITSFANREMAVIGTSQPYAQYHQTGTANMPQRQIFGLSETDRSDIRNELNYWLNSLWSKHEA